MLRDSILALSALGFNEETANKMVTQVVQENPSVSDVETVIRLALSRGK
jgi:Holliday junction resolvasome RuvABC DNA-binding subunit